MAISGGKVFVTYPDSSLIINVFIANTAIRQRALDILDDTNRVFMVSDYLRLELLPKMRYEKQTRQIQFVSDLFRSASVFIPSSATIIAHAEALGETYGLAAMDALHVACAIAGNADELITFEKPTKPFFRIPPDILRITSLYETPARATLPL
jgi:predicted nucleic acid-binding protein